LRCRRERRLPGLQQVYARTRMAAACIVHGLMEISKEAKPPRWLLYTVRVSLLEA
jgi:hypothetical protein